MLLAGIHIKIKILDSCFRRNDNLKTNMFASLQQKEFSPKVYIALGITVSIFAILWFISLQWKDHLFPRNIVVEGTSIISKEEVQRLLNVPEQTSMYDMDLTILQNGVKQNSFVKSAIIKRDAPSTLRVMVKEREPVAILISSNSSQLFYIDEEGYVLQQPQIQNTFDIPFISGISVQAAQIGNRTTNEDVLAALRIVLLAKKSSSEIFNAISEIKIQQGKDILLYATQNGIPIIFGNTDIEEKIVKLETFFEQYKQQIDSLKYIDVRFTDQVIVGTKKI